MITEIVSPLTMARNVSACRAFPTRCCATIEDLLAENKKLKVRAKAGESGKLKDTMERAKLESELHNIRRLVERIPPDVLEQVKHEQQHKWQR